MHNNFRHKHDREYFDQHAQHTKMGADYYIPKKPRDSSKRNNVYTQGQRRTLAMNPLTSASTHSMIHNAPFFATSPGESLNLQPTAFNPRNLPQISTTRHKSVAPSHGTSRGRKLRANQNVSMLMYCGLCSKLTQ